MHPRILKLKSLFFRIDFTRRSKFLTHALQLNQKLQKLNRRSLKTRKTLFYFHLCALTRRRRLSAHIPSSSEFVEKTFQATQLTHERFLTIDHSCKVFFWYLPNWTSTDLLCVVLYVAYSTTNQRLVEVQFGRYQKNILQEWCRVKKLSCVSYGSLKRFPHTFTSAS